MSNAFDFQILLHESLLSSYLAKQLKKIRKINRSLEITSKMIREYGTGS